MEMPQDGRKMLRAEKEDQSMFHWRSSGWQLAQLGFECKSQSAEPKLPKNWAIRISCWKLWPKPEPMEDFHHPIYPVFPISQLEHQTSCSSSGSNNKSTNRTCQEDRINKSLLPNWFKKYAKGRRQASSQSASQPSMYISTSLSAAQATRLIVHWKKSWHLRTALENVSVSMRYENSLIESIKVASTLAFSLSYTTSRFINTWYRFLSVHRSCSASAR